MWYKNISRGSLIWIGVAILFSIGWVYSGGLFEADFKAGEPRWYWMTLMILVMSIPLAIGILYLSSWAERLWGEKSYFVPVGVFWLWTTTIITASIVWLVASIIFDNYQFYSDVLRRLYSPLSIVYVGGAILLWFIPQDKGWYRGIMSICIGFLVALGLVLGLVSQRSSFVWFFGLSTERQEMMQGRKEFPLPPDRTVSVIFRNGLTTEEWERYLEKIQWAIFGYKVERAVITITNCKGLVLAEMTAQNNLEQVRAAYKAQVFDIDWYQVCVASMAVTGELGNNEFEKVMESRPGLGQEVVNIDWGIVEDD
jgi:hypothetical protein